MSKDEFGARLRALLALADSQGCERLAVAMAHSGMPMNDLFRDFERYARLPLDHARDLLRAGSTPSTTKPALAPNEATRPAPRAIASSPGAAYAYLPAEPASVEAPSATKPEAPTIDVAGVYRRREQEREAAMRQHGSHT